MKTSLKTLLAGILVVLICQQRAPAQTIAIPVVGATTTENSVILGQNDVQGYEFYGATTLASSNPFYASVALNSLGGYTGPTAPAYGYYTSITVGTSVATATSITTGIVYNNSVFEVDRYDASTFNPLNPTAQITPTTFYQLATVTLTASTPSEFTLGILNSNTNDRNNNTLYEVSLNGGTPLPLNLVYNTDYDTNDFYNVLVTGAGAGDTITLYGGNDPSHYMVGNSNSYQNVIGFGGLVFSSPIPEPSSYALVLAGIGVLLATARISRRRV